jgi:hypothetical protein
MCKENFLRHDRARFTARSQALLCVEGVDLWNVLLKRCRKGFEKLLVLRWAVTSPLDSSSSSKSPSSLESSLIAM